ncbi:MAG: LPS-assembly protein LptD [Bacteroidales bacterium]|nr:LPS-assembly protein LptD [Bacteroidales bacterium]
MSQDTDLPKDTLVNKFLPDTISADTVFGDSIFADTTSADTLLMNSIADTISIPVGKSGSKQSIDSKVTYTAKDSMVTSVSDRKLYLYGETQVNYENIELKADYMAFDMGNSVVKATSMNDSTGNPIGKPSFKQDAETFESDTISYNFKTKKGMIKNIVTQQGEGFLHSQITKKHASGHIHIKNGRYTTCDAPHPHFYIGLTKAIAIPDDKIISGPAYLVIEDIPLPIMLPFGFFPNSKRRAAGILIPSYGEEQARGFFLRQGGIYIPISDYFDFVLQADVYTRGTFGFNAKSTYNWKYHFTGSFDGKIYFNRVNDDPTYNSYNDYSINWRHSQSPKANPTRTFSANVSISTASYNKNYSYDQETYLRNNQSSSIQYSKRWGSMFALNATLNHNQDNRTKQVNMTLPNVAFTVNRFYPFRSKNMKGAPRWFENIQLSYSSSLQNKISATDTTLFKKFDWRKMQNGFSHSIPVSMANIRLLKVINITPSLSYQGVAYTSNIEKSYPDTVPFTKNPSAYIITDTTFGFRYAHAIKPSISISASPKLYGMFQSTNPNSYIRAVRHVMTFSAGFGFSPDISDYMPKYYRTIRYPRSPNEKVNEQTYSIFDGYLYGTPVARGSVGAISLGFGNNLEMKVLSKNDTTGEPKKVSILDNLNFSSSYNPFKDSMRLADISMNGSTRLFNNKVSLTFGGNFSPYSIDKAGRPYNRLYFNETSKLLRLTRFNFSLSTSLQSGGGKKSSSETGEQPPEGNRTTYNDEADLFVDYVDFSIPWTLSIQYAWNYSKAGLVKNIDHTVRLSGDLSLTKKWKIGGNTGYDFIAGKVATTNLSISRDLHCWTMQISAVPFGPRKSYSFSINAKSAMLRDLKWDKRKSWYDSY